MPGFTLKLTLGAMFLALGILFPLLFHAVGLGSVFLPMFWPVAAAGFFLPFPTAVLVGILPPVLSFLLTGMPPVSPPVLHVMAAELVCLSGAVSLIRSRTRWGTFWILLLSLILSRTVLFFTAKILAPFFDLPAKWISFASVLKGLPGVVVMLFLIPVIVGRINHASVWKMGDMRERNA
jgi:hypothetical protein